MHENLPHLSDLADADLADLAEVGFAEEAFLSLSPLPIGAVRSARGSSAYLMKIKIKLQGAGG